jgi:hypothetical protein
MVSSVFKDALVHHQAHHHVHFSPCPCQQNAIPPTPATTTMASPSAERSPVVSMTRILQWVLL